MLHPWKEIMMRLEALGITQKDFSQKIGKRVSEINELIKGKRNITIAWEFILSDFFKTAPKYWIYKQVDYDYIQMQNELELKKSFLEENGVYNKWKKESLYKENIRLDKVDWKNNQKNKVSWWNTNWNAIKTEKVENGSEKNLSLIENTKEKEQKNRQEEIFKKF